MISKGEPRLNALISSGDFAAASQLCRDRLSSAVEDRPRWLLRSGWVSFLNYKDVEDKYVRASEDFGLLARETNDPEAHFWLGYTRFVLSIDEALGEQELRTCLSLAPNHPYANLVVASCPGTEHHQATVHLLRTLNVQPTNYRALRDLADLAITDRRIGDARAALLKIVEDDPYVEVKYEFMNDYVNGVLTGSFWKERYRREAHLLLTGL